MNNVLVVATLAALAACGGKKSDASAGSGSGGSSDSPALAKIATGDAGCDGAVNTAIDTIVAKKQQQGGAELAPQRLERFAKLRVALGTRCATDHWPPAMLACVTTMQSQADLVRCMGQLDPTSAGKLQADIAGAMMGGRGPRPPMLAPADGSAGPTPGMHPREPVDVGAAIDKRIGVLNYQLDIATKHLEEEVTDEADRKAAKAEVDRLTREKTQLEKQRAMIGDHAAPLGSGGFGAAKP